MLERSFDPRVRASRAALVAAAVLVAMLLGATGAQARILIGSNYRLGADLTPGRGKDSVGLAVDPRNARHIVEVDADWLKGQCEYHVSFDAGRTWRGGPFHVPTGFRQFEPCTVGPHLAAHMQAGVVYGSGNNVYATFVSPKDLGNGFEQGKSLFVVVSRDGGRTFRTAQEVIPGGPDTTRGPDFSLPTIGVERARRGGLRHDVVYVAGGSTEASHVGASTENIGMAISRDAGATWGTPFNVNTPDENAIEQSRIVVGRDGTVYLAWRDRGRGAAPGTFTPEGTVVMAKSRDRGLTWTRSVVAQVRGYVYTGPPVSPFNAGTTFTGSTFPRIAIDPGRNILYVVYGQGSPTPPEDAPASAARVKAHAADHFINPDQHVYFQRSTDGGATWSTPKQINTTSALNTEVAQTRHPFVDVAPNGRVDVVWQDRRHWYRGCTNTHVACQEARLGDTYWAYSTNQGRTFSRNYRISDRSTNNDVGFDYRFGTYWAYGPVTAELGHNRLLVAWMDSREGNLQTDSQDIYLSRVALHTRAALPVHRIVRRTPVDLSVALSRLAYAAGPEAVLAGTFVSRPWTRVVIVNEHDVAGVLAAGVLARANLATVLLSPSTGLPASVKAEVARLQPIGAYVIGSEGALSPTVVSDLGAAGVPPDQIVRLAGADPAATARLIAGAEDRRTPADKAAGKPAFDAAIIANPASPDAYTASVLAADRRLPVFYVSSDTLPADTASALKELNISRTLVIGGTSVVSDAVAGQLPAPTRLGGSDVYGTSRAVVAQSKLRDVPDNVVYVTDGSSSMEAALLGAPVGRVGGLQLVARGGRRAALRTISGSSALRASVMQVRVIEKKAKPRRR